MSERFLITGLPRSRTAWFAALASALPGAICHHEAISYPHITSWQQAALLWEREMDGYIGISDSSFGFHLPEIMTRWAPRVLVVQRNWQDVVAACERLGLVNAAGYCEALVPKLLAVQGNPSVRFVEFADLVDDEVVRSCLWWLMPGVSIPMDLIRIYQRFNVQADLAQVMAAVRTKEKHLPALLGIA